MNASPFMSLLSVQHVLKPLVLILLLPPISLLLLTLLGAILLGRRPWLGRSLLAVGLLGLWISFTEAGADSLQRALLGMPSALSPTQIERLRKQPDTAVLVLGAGIRPQVPEYGGPTVKPLTLERLRYGIWLARRSELPLGFTGGVGWSSEAGAQPEAEVVLRVAAEEFGLPLRWAESASRDTRENAALSLPILKRDGIKHLLLVTHSEHMPRAIRAFQEAAGGQVEIVPAPLGLREDLPYTFVDWLPSADSFKKIRYVLYEWLGLVAGR